MGSNKAMPLPFLTRHLVLALNTSIKVPMIEPDFNPGSPELTNDFLCCMSNSVLKFFIDFCVLWFVIIHSYQKG